MSKDIPIAIIPKSWLTKKSIMVIGSKTYKIKTLTKNKAIWIEKKEREGN